MSWWRPRACQECETLRAEVKRLRADVEDTADKVFHWMKRHSARAARENGREEPGNPAPEPEAMDGTVSPRVAALLRRRSNGHAGISNP